MNNANNITEAQAENTMDIDRQRFLKLISRLATIMCIAMYVSYIPQIIANFTGHPVSPVQPLVAAINASLWTSYGWLKTKKDWPVIISNIPGIFFGIFTVITVYIH
ncbi:hypothetical protein WGH24286_00816 [Periweissella ghanensis]|uniref:Small conserved membrane protein n=2 Tax=Periweissella ghanensis TaxID=467997 RepID=A0ABM8ZCK1_9LACO|nr:hypothetical protein WGH24286_00816 [Periweissella ghanensis]